MANKQVIDGIIGKRFDVVASEMLPDISRSYVTSLIKAGSITVDGRQEKAGYKIKKGDSVTIDVDITKLQSIPDITLPIIYEDDNVIVIDKPEGVISHSRGRYWYEPSVASFIRQKTGQEGDRTGIVHRLDRVTSGVMICAKNQATLTHLQKQFNQRTVKKRYIAVTEGHLKEPSAIIDMPIERNPKKPSQFRVGPNGKASQTEYQVQKSGAKHDLVLLMPKTGRTHQLRVHLKELGHPIVGDHLYGTQGDRLYLHAESLEITLPGGDRKTFTSKVPASFTELVHD